MYAVETVSGWSFPRKRVTLDRVHELELDKVLFVILSAEDSERPRKNGRRRVAEVYGYDHYVLALWTRDRKRYVMLDGWDDHKLSTWHSEEEPFRDSCAGGKLRLSAPPFGVFHRVFDGIELPNADWERAVEVFHEEMH